MPRYLAIFVALLFIPATARAADLNLDDLGYSSQETQGDPRQQQLLDKRSRLLKNHQRLGLLTLIPLTATILTAGGAKNGSRGDRNLHAGMASVTGAMYFTTAGYAFFAPEVAGAKHRGPTKLHKALAFIHFPAMIATPILGVIAYNQRNHGEKVHGAAKYHSTAGGIAAATFAAAMLTMTIKF